jgi:site-specific recombinase XerD
MVEAMVLGRLRRCEVLGTRLGDLRVGPRRVFIAEGKGGHQRLIPVSSRFFASVAAYLDAERPQSESDRVFLVLKGLGGVSRSARPVLTRSSSPPGAGSVSPMRPFMSCATPA